MPVAIPSVSVSMQNHSGTVVYRNLVINQAVNDHHHFSFIWNVGTLNHDAGSQLDIIKNNIGSVVTIEIDDYRFQGIITQMSVHEQTDSSQSFTVKGQSNTILLDDVPHSASYYKKDLKKIINTTLDGIPGNVMSTSIDPQTTDELHYVTQYNETDWQFIQRLATRYGEWFYYDGTTLKFGPTGDSNATLRSGSNLTSYTVKANIVSNKYNYTSYDYHKGEPVVKEQPSFSSDVKNDFSSAVANKSKEVYSRSVDRPMHNFNLVNKNMIDSVAELDMKRLSAQLLFTNGESKHGALRPGYKFVVETANGNYDYIVTHVTHTSNVVGHYENSFRGVPATVKVPPYTNPHVFRQANTQTALVKENHDPDGINRVKVHFFWQKDADCSPWIRVATPHAGGGKGMHIIPEKDEEVIIAFEGGDVDKPFVINSIYSGSAKSGGGDADNNVKSFSSRSGNKISLDDKDGCVIIVDKAGNELKIDGSGNISLTASESITLTSGQSSISLKKDGTIAIKGGKTVEIEGTSDSVKVSSMNKVEISGTASTVLKSDAKVEVKSAMTSVEGQGSLKLSSTGMVDIEGTAMTNVKGGVVNLN